MIGINTNNFLVSTYAILLKTETCLCILHGCIDNDDDAHEPVHANTAKILLSCSQQPI